MRNIIIIFLCLFVLGCAKKEEIKTEESKRYPYLREDGYLVPFVFMLKVKQYEEAPKDWDFICKDYPYKKVPQKIIKRLQKIGFRKGVVLNQEHTPTPSEIDCWCDGFYGKDIIR